MKIEKDYVDPMLINSVECGRNNFKDEQELKNIYKQLVDLVSNGTYKLRKIYDHPLDDDVLLPICKDKRVTVKARIRKYVLEDIAVHEYIFIYKGGESDVQIR